MANGSDGSVRVSVVRPRLDEKPWGGRRLERYGFELPEDATIGEALATAGEARIVSGAGEGNTIGDLVAADPDGSLGELGLAVVGGRSVFPLLVKLIDASENLSIQVHPNDSQATRHDRMGKTEAWHVLAAEPGACIYVGLRDGVSVEEFRTAAERMDGSSSSLLRRVPAELSSTILLPAGTVHALGAGVMVYEIQQPSDITYRIDDWGRVDAHGNPRAMHLDDGLAVMRPESRPAWIEPVALPTNEGRRHALVACRYFALERVALPGGGACALPVQQAPQVVTLLSGRAIVDGETLDAGMSAVVWPGQDPVMFRAAAPAVALRGWVPDLAADFRELARQTTVDVAALEKLSGTLSDVREALADGL